MTLLEEIPCLTEENRGRASECIPNMTENLNLGPSQSLGIGRSNLAPIPNRSDDSIAPIAGAFASAPNQIFNHVRYQFEVLHPSKKSHARVGKIHTPHGTIDTPNFVGVGTNGTLKALDNSAVQRIGLQLMFCNTYHLLLQPGTHIVKQAGGLHRYINRSLPIITDSGGFQVFSLAYGSVADELKSKGLKKLGGGHVLKITE